MKQTVSPSPIIPAVLALTKEEFTKKYDFAASVGAVHFDVIDNDFARGQALTIDHWPEKIDIAYSEVHLMVRRPIEYLEKLASHGINRAIVHIESEIHQVDLLNRARELDLLIGFAINPDTDLLKLKQFLNTNTYIQVMGVKPGSANQEMLEGTDLSVSYIQKTTMRRVMVSVDGGVTEQNVPGLVKAGANYFVSTHAIFHEGDWKTNYTNLVAAVEANQ